MSDRAPSPQLGGATEAFVHERASATPHTHAARARDGGLAATAVAPPLPGDGSLRALEGWLVGAITTPGGGDRLDADAEQVLTAGRRLAAADRLGIYRYAYRARLVECLADDYPALAYALGRESEERFEALCHAYIERHPSSSPSLNFFGRHMESFCRERGEAFEADLAALEWALVEVLHAPLAEALSLEALAAIPPSRWTDARLPPSSAVRLLRLAHPVNAFFQSFKLGEEPAIPAASPCQVAVYRTDVTLWRMELTPAMAELLGALFSGATLGEALGRLEGTLTPAEASEAERSVMIWFREWVRGGLFARVVLGSDQ